MSSKTMRIKLIVLPYNEKMCIVTKSNASITELQESVHATLLKYPMYELLLSSCTAILELRSNGEDFAISGNYKLYDLLKEKDDIIAVKLANKSHCMCQRLQPKKLALFAAQSAINKNKNKNEHQEEKKEESLSKKLDEPQQKELLSHFQKANIFDLMHEYNQEKNINGSDNKNNGEYQSILIELKSFCLNWFEQNKNKNETYDTKEILNALSANLYSSFESEINYLSTSYFITSDFEWQQQLFMELGFKPQIDPHTNLSIDMNKYELTWNDYLVFDDINTEILTKEIKKRFISNIAAWNKYGFSTLPQQYFSQTKNEWFNLQIKTVSGGNLVSYVGWNHLISDLRNSKLMLFAFNAKAEATKLMKTDAFKYSITTHEQYGFTINTEQWLRFCLDKKVLPITLLKGWITESKQAFMTKREFNKFIKIIADIPSKNKREWLTQKHEYYHSVNKENAQKYALYLEACAVYNKYIEKYDGKLNGYLCDQMIELFFNDSVQGFVCEAGDHRVAALFEQHIVDKFRFIVSCINNTQRYGADYKLLDQQQQVSFWTLLREKYFSGVAKLQRSTPDILLNKAIIINNKRINWFDAKHFFISSSSKILFKRFVQSAIKYTKAYGNGAVICNGFQQNVDQHPSIQKYNVTLLDGSRDLSVYYQT